MKATDRFWSRIKKHWQFIIIIILLFIFFVPIIGVFVYHKFNISIGELYTFGINEMKDFFTFWIALFGVIGVVYNIFQNQRRITNQEKQLTYQAKQQRDGRFSTGVELLGHKSQSVRIGGVYNLFFLAKENPIEYKESVFEILSFHVKDIIDNSSKEPVTNEIQTIIDLLLKKYEGEFVFPGCVIKSWNGLNLFMANFSAANLFQANLAGANLVGAHIAEANFSGANLSGAYLTGAYLSKIDLSKTDLFVENLGISFIYNTRLPDGVLEDYSIKEVDGVRSLTHKTN
jgi:hypothetical protein